MVVRYPQSRVRRSPGSGSLLRSSSAVRWYLRFGLSYRDVEELLAERGIEVDNVTVYRWVQRFMPILADVKVIVQALDALYDLLKEELA